MWCTGCPGHNPAPYKVSVLNRRTRLDLNCDIRVAAKMTSFTFSQRGKRLLSVDGYLYQHNRDYTNKSGDVVAYWRCERMRDLKCAATVKTDKDGNIVKQPEVQHLHAANEARVQALSTRHGLLEECLRRPEAAPSALLNEFVSPDVVLSLGNETALKQAVQRRRRFVRPKEPDIASGIQICGDWAQTIDGKSWYLGDVRLEEDCGYIFTTDDNLRHLQVGWKVTIADRLVF